MFLDENLNRQSHIALILNEVSKNIRLLIKVSKSYIKVSKSYTFPVFISRLIMQISYGPALIRQKLNTDQVETCNSNHV